MRIRCHVHKTDIILTEGGALGNDNNDMLLLLLLKVNLHVVQSHVLYCCVTSTHTNNSVCITCTLVIYAFQGRLICRPGTPIYILTDLLCYGVVFFFFSMIYNSFFTARMCVMCFCV
jgi:hypothetical protein